MASQIVASYDWESDTFTHHGDNPARIAWRDAVAEIADNAKAKLPACNGRVDSAVKIVLAGDVELLPDGKAKVASQSNGQVVYHIVNGECSCKDYPKAPSNWCKHRIAAGIHKRAYALAKAKLAELDRVATETGPPAARPQPAPAAWCLMCHTAVSDLADPLCTGCHRCKAHCGQTTPECIYPTVPVPAQPAPDAPAPTPAPASAAALPEAPVSITLKAMLHGHEVLVTLRGVNFASVKAQVEQASEWLKVQAPAPPPTPPPAQDTGEGTPDENPYCHKHRTAMRRFSKDGRTWHSHKTTDGRWCKGA